MKHFLFKSLLLVSILNSFSNVYSQSYEEWSKNPDGKISVVLVTKKQDLKCAKCYKTCVNKIVAPEDFDYSNSNNPEYFQRYCEININPILYANALTDNAQNKCPKSGCQESYSGNHIWEVLDEKITRERFGG